MNYELGNIGFVMIISGVIVTFSFAVLALYYVIVEVVFEGAL